MTDLASRIAVLEADQRHNAREIGEIKRGQQSIESKLDELLALRNKGAGVFWLASILFGTGLFGAGTALAEWVRH